MSGGTRKQSGGRRWRGIVVAWFLALALIFSSVAGLWSPRDVLGSIPIDSLPSPLQRVAGPWLGQPTRVVIPGAFLYQQQRPLSCEYSATAMAARMGGWDVNEYDFDTLVPHSENPHLGYRGNILGEWGNTTDYGVYNTPLHLALDEMGIPNTAFYAAGDRNKLKAELNQDRPVVVWLAMRGDINSFDAYMADGTRYQLTQYMHVMVAYGYDEDGVYLTDPGTAIWRFYPWDEFMSMWNVMDGMALSVHPR